MIYVVIIPLLLSLVGGLNYYIGLRGWQWLQSLGLEPTIGPVYWGLFWLLAFSFILARLLARALPRPVADGLTKIGAYWLAFFVYALQLLVVLDVLLLLNRWVGFVPAPLMPTATQFAGGAVCLLLIALVAYGSWRARTPVIIEHSVAISKSAGEHKELHVVIVSDLHLGAIVGTSRIRQLVTMVNRLEPDLILMPGDIIDDDLRPFQARNMAAELGRMQSRLGTYASLGNHDPTPAGLPAYRAELERVGIHLLIDEWVLVDGSFYVAARNDSLQARRAGAQPVPLTDVLAGADRTLPILLMDHQPDRLADAVAVGVDLQVSGHTHRGQVFPGNLITRRVFEVDWGYLKKEATHFIVSVGFGTWGPPIRIGNRPEVVSVRVIFQ